MQPTKYPPETPSDGAVGSCAGGMVAPMHGGVIRDPCGGTCASGCPHAGREAPLDLIEEHLTYKESESLYRQGEHGGRLLKNWMVPASWNGVKEGERNFVLKIQSFAKGGYEGTIRLLDLEKIGRAIEGGGARGKREAPEEVSIDHQEKAASRAKRKMRHLVKNMMADHLVTFTKAEGPGTKTWGDREWEAWESGGRDAWEEEHGAFMGPEQWAKAWDRFRRLLSRMIGEFPYVAILEKHRKGNYHLHVAWCGRVNVGIVRKMWLAALGGGKGCGNIDARKIKVPAGGDRAARIARYISKYVSKHFENDPRFNKKRYWASRQTLEEARRYVLNANTLDAAANEVEAMLGFRFCDRVVMAGGKRRFEEFFSFPDGSGFWWAHVPGLHDTVPPF